MIPMTEAGISISFKIADPEGIEKMVTFREPASEDPQQAKDLDRKCFERVAAFTKGAMERGWRPLLGAPAKPAQNQSTQAQAPAPAKPQSGGQGTGDCTFIATTLTIEFNPKGEKSGKLKGGRFEKFGVRLWPEVAKVLGFDLEQYEAGEYKIEPISVRYVEHEGKPSKVIGRAS